MADFIPSSEGNMASWLVNLLGKIIPTGTLLGVPMPQLKAAQQKAQLLITELANATAAQAESRKATAIKDAQKKESLKIIRALVVILKANPLWTSAMAKDLQLIMQTLTVDPVNYKAKLTAKLDGGGIRLRISKRGVQAVNIYTRLQGEDKWILLEKVTRSTYTDKRPLTTAGVAEIRQYQIRGIMADQEIGHMSDIVSISYGG